MSLHGGDGLTYVEYINSPRNVNVVNDSTGQKTYYITVNSPVNIVNGLDNTPESDTQYLKGDLDSSPDHKLYSSRAYFDDTLAMSSSFTLTPDKDSPELYTPERSAGFLEGLRDSGKRGRPRADVINHLMVEGSHSGSNIKCKICSR